MLERRPLGLHPRFTHLVDWGSTLSLLTDTGAVVVEDAAAVAVVRAIDGTLDELALVGSLPDVLPERAHFALMVMAERAIVRAVGEPRIEREAAEGDGAPAAGALRRAWRAVGAEGSLASLHPSPVDFGFGTSAALVLVSDGLSPELCRFDEEAHERGQPYLPVWIGRERLWIGPAIIPGTTSCWACVRTRLWDNLAARQVLHAEHGRGPSRRPHSIRPLPHEPDPAAFERLATALAAAHRHSSLERCILELDLEGRPRDRHAIVPRPQCPRCGDPSIVPPGPAVVLASRPGALGLATGRRVRPVRDTLARLRPLVSPLTGVVRGVRAIELDDDATLHVYTAGHSMPLLDHLPASLKAHASDASGGKGLSAEEAEASALCEAIERQSAVYTGSEPHVTCALEELAGRVVPPSDLLHFSDRQYAERDRLNAANAPFHWIPQSYQPREALRWTRARSLLTGEDVWVPLGFVFLGVGEPDARYARGDSNGLAAGNCVEEAILQGLLELVERDAVALWWYSRTRHPAVDLEALEQSHWVHRVRDVYARHGRDLWVLDVTSDLEIPCYVAVSAARASRGDVVFGFGAHLDPAIALNRSIGELHQLIPSVLAPPEERRERLGHEYADALRWWEEATLDAHPYLQPSGPPVALDRWRSPVRDDMRDGVRDDIRDDIEWCLQRAASVGTDVLVHDLSRPDFALSVVRVIAPELRHFWRRLGRGRLYDVPVRLGRVPRALREDELNPHSIFV